MSTGNGVHILMLMYSHKCIQYVTSSEGFKANRMNAFGPLSVALNALLQVLHLENYLNWFLSSVKHFKK